MLETGDTELMILGDALRVALDGKFTPADKEWINRIETLRAELETSAREIVVDDFGTLPPGTRRIPERPLGGRTYVRTISGVIQSSPKRDDGELLMSLVKAYAPDTVVELGTGVGISTAYLAAGMVGRDSRIVTLEGSDALVELAQQNLNLLALRNVEVVLGRFQDTLERVMRREVPVDMMFFDGHHEGTATLNYFTRALPYLSARAVLIFRGIMRNEAMQSAWQEIMTHDRVDVAVDMAYTGVCIVKNHSGRHLNYKIVLS
jgi:predicted O-methyltransferase YrrM